MGGPAMDDAGAPPPGSAEALRARHGDALPLAAAAVGDGGHHGLDHVVHRGQRGHPRPVAPVHAGAGARAVGQFSGFMVAMTVSMLTTPWLLARFGYRATYNGCMCC
jgi:hypothetical protein